MTPAPTMMSLSDPVAGRSCWAIPVPGAVADSEQCCRTPAVPRTACEETKCENGAAPPVHSPVYRCGETGTVTKEITGQARQRMSKLQTSFIMTSWNSPPPPSPPQGV